MKTADAIVELTREIRRLRAFFEKSSAPAQPPSPLPTFLSMATITKQLGISQATGWRWHASGRLGPAGLRRGGKRLFERAEFAAWLVAKMPPRDEWGPTWAARQKAVKSGHEYLWGR